MNGKSLLQQPVAPDRIYLPQSAAGSTGADHAHAKEIRAIRSYLDHCSQFISSAFAAPPPAPVHSPGAGEILRILLGRDFNYQSRGRVSHLLPRLEKDLRHSLGTTGEIPVFLLYHGGYRASVHSAGPSLCFEPGITEFLLLYQIARLHHRLQAIGADGLRFSIVINNGVAFYTNGIPYPATELYVKRLRALIGTMNAGRHVSVLAQSELGSFEDRMRTIAITPKQDLSPAEHGMVERFLGRSCPPEEACRRVAAYEQAEAVWGTQIHAMVTQRSGLYCRQIAHPACLSFRPFPGGAIRVQNGTIGFRFTSGQRPVPVLVTPATLEKTTVIPLAMDGTIPGPPRSRESRLAPASSFRDR